MPDIERKVSGAGSSTRTGKGSGRRRIRSSSGMTLGSHILVGSIVGHNNFELLTSRWYSRVALAAWRIWVAFSIAEKVPISVPSSVLQMLRSKDVL